MKKILSLIICFLIVTGCSKDKDTIFTLYPNGEDPAVYEEFNISEDFEYFINKENDLIQFSKLNNDSIYIKLFKYSNRKHLINVFDTIESHTIDFGFGEKITYQLNRVFPTEYVQNKYTNCYLFLLMDKTNEDNSIHIKAYFENKTNGEIKKDTFFYLKRKNFKAKATDYGFLLGNEYFSRIYNIDGSLYLEDHSGLNLSEAYSLNKNIYVYLLKETDKNVITAWRYDVSTQEKKSLEVFHWDNSKLKVKKTSSKIKDDILYIYLETVSLEGVFKDLTFRIDTQSMQIL